MKAKKYRKFEKGTKYTLKYTTKKKRLKDIAARKLKEKGYSIRTVKTKGYYLLYAVKLITEKELIKGRDEGWGDISHYR